MYWTIPEAVLWTVDIIFLPESNGASPILGLALTRSFLLIAVTPMERIIVTTAGSPSGMAESAGKD